MSHDIVFTRHTRTGTSHAPKSMGLPACEGQWATRHHHPVNSGICGLCPFGGSRLASALLPNPVPESNREVRLSAGSLSALCGAST